MLVIIAKKVQKAMQGQHPKLGLQGVAGLAGLAARNTHRNHDIAKKTLLLRGKRQDVGGRIFSAVLPVQRPHACVGHQGHGDFPSGTRGCGGGEPRAQARRPSTPLGAGACGDDDVDDEAVTF
ncbi:MAG: hypothetical protein Q7J25_14300 [Vicinamibacterales bacterium]|nr:hypothetical protein [Vicinamibacterales bacterium]